MYDLARVSEFTGGALGQSASNIFASGAVPQITELGTDAAQLRDTESVRIMCSLSEIRTDVSRLHAAQLSTIAADTGDADQLPELLGRSTGRAS